MLKKTYPCAVKILFLNIRGNLLENCGHIGFYPMVVKLCKEIFIHKIFEDFARRLKVVEETAL